MAPKEWVGQLTFIQRKWSGCSSLQKSTSKASHLTRIMMMIRMMMKLRKSEDEDEGDCEHNQRFPLRRVAAVRQRVQAPLQPVHHLWVFVFFAQSLIFVLLAFAPRAPLLVIVARCKPDIPRWAHLHIGAYITKTISSKGSYQVKGDAPHSFGRLNLLTNKQTV